MKRFLVRETRQPNIFGSITLQLSDESHRSSESRFSLLGLKLLGGSRERWIYDPLRLIQLRSVLP